MENRNRLYDDAIAAYGTALQRLARGYEADPESFAAYAAASYLLRARRASSGLVSLEALETEPGFSDGEAEADRAHSLAKLLGLIGNLKPLDRQTFLLYPEGETAASIAEITGLSATNVATKLHRIRKLLIERFNALQRRSQT